MDIPDELIHPYASTPPRIALDVADALARCHAVSRVTLFGSLATGTHDGWSDIDVMCVTPSPAGAWEAARLLRDAMPFRWYGPFSGMPSPSGRYWPYGEALFHSVDLSFRTAEAHARVLSEGLRGRPVTTRDLHLREPGPASGRDDTILSGRWEYPFTTALNGMMTAIRMYMRSRGEWGPVSATMEVLEAEARALPHQPNGGRPQDVLDEARSLYRRLLMDRLQAGVGS